MDPTHTYMPTALYTHSQHLPKPSEFSHFAFPPPPLMADKTTATQNSGGSTEKTAGNATASPTSHLETAKAERHVWLMKCPPVVSRSFEYQQKKLLNEQPPPQFLYNQLPPPPLLSSDDVTNQQDCNNSSSGAPIAKVIVSIDPLLPTDDVKATEFMMELAGTESGNVPKIYSMDMSTDFVPMSVFSESGQGKLSVEGKIYHKFDMKPHSETIQDYGKLCRERTKKYMTKTRQIQVLDDDGGMLLRPMPGMVTAKTSGTPDKKKLQSKASDVKRTRRGRDEMEEIMFKLFERQPNWTLKQPIHETDQPEQFLKDMLKLLCVYNNNGANQGTYELKPEYKNTGHAAAPQ